MLSLRAVLHACAAAALVAAAACADSTSAPVQPAPVEPPPTAQRLVCRASVANRTVECAAPGAAAGVRADRIVGQGEGLKLTSSNVAVVADSFAFDMTMTTWFDHPVGTTDGINPDPNGSRVFFVDGVHTTSGTGSVTVANADGVGTFTATGQPYFAYHGVLAPGATTAPRRWKLRFDPGVATFSFDLYVSLPVPPGGGTVAITILQPLPDDLVGDSLVVVARIDSASASVQLVTAYAADTAVTLQPYAPGLVRGTLPIVAPFGPVHIRVHAVTVGADSGNAYVTVHKDAPPVLTVTAPAQDWVARPNLRIDADCVDDDPAGCVSITARIGLVQLASGTGGIHTDVSLAAYEETRQVVRIDAIDSRGYTRTALLTVRVESRPLLTFVDSAGSKAMDVDSSRLLFADAANAVWVRDRAGGTRTLVQSGRAGVPFGWLHPAGAIFARPPSNLPADWRNGALVQLFVVPQRDLVVQGTWAVFGSLERRDLLTGTNVTAAFFSNGEDAQADVAANGDVVYVFSTGVRRNRNGAHTTITTGNSAWPVTDGVNVVYLKGAQVAMWNGTSETLLSNALTGAAKNTHYAVNGGWVAYAFTDGAGQTQIRTRAPDGTIRQVTRFGSSSVIRALSAEGTLVIANAGVQYVIRAPYAAGPTTLGPDWFRATFRGTELLLFLGNTVFSASY